MEGSVPISPEIRRSLVLSTAHIPGRIAREMDSYATERGELAEELEQISFDCVNYGYQIWVPGDARDVPGTPPELEPAFALARKHNCTYVVFDCDGFEHPELLPLYEW